MAKPVPAVDDDLLMLGHFDAAHVVRCHERSTGGWQSRLVPTTAANSDARIVRTGTTLGMLLH
jgi:hypothetical protein